MKRNDLKVKLLKVAYLAVQAEMDKKLTCYQMALDFSEMQRKAAPNTQTQAQAENVLRMVDERNMVADVAAEVKKLLDGLMKDTEELNR